MTHTRGHTWYNLGPSLPNNTVLEFEHHSWLEWEGRGGPGLEAPAKKAGGNGGPPSSPMVPARKISK